MRYLNKNLFFISLFVFALSSACFAQEESSSDYGETRSSASSTSTGGVDSVAPTSNLGPEFGDIFAGRAGKSRFASSFFQLGSFRMEGMHRGEAGYSSYNYFALNYRLGQGETISFRPVFFFDTPGQNFNGDVTGFRTDLGDAYIEWSKNRWARLLDDGNVRFALRVALPTSQISKDRGMITNVMAYFIITKRLARKFQVDWHLKPQAFAYDKTGYYLADRDQVRGNQMASLDHFIDFSYSLSYRFRVSHNFGSEHQYFFPVQSEGMRGFRIQRWRYQTALVTNVTSSWMLLTGVQHTRDLDRPRGGFSLYREDETQYVLLSSVRF